MLVNFDLIGELENQLKKAGYRDSGPVAGSQGRIFAHNRRRVLTVRKMKVPKSAIDEVLKSGGQDQSVNEKILDNWCQDFIEDLKRIADEGNTPCDLVFQGGGTIPLPDWFRSAAEALGFQIRFIGPGSDTPFESVI